MKKLSTTLITIGILITALTLLVLRVNGVDWWQAVKNAVKRNFQTQTAIIEPKDVDKITIYTNDDPIKIMPANDDLIKFKHYNSDDIEFMIDSSNGELIIRQHRKNSFRIGFNLYELVQSSRELTLYVPTNSNLTYAISTTNNDIEMFDIATDDVSLSTSNAQIEAHIIGTADAYRKDIKTTPYSILIINGVKYSNVLKTSDGVKNLNIKTSNGDIKLDFLK
ncbi:MAG: DUF4097 domain-containing protein [Candidatus Nomurabacteria bacterium]|jgi:hypothetical protein|nr:DUF4097 domain-containing protein [Candidatus Nomurabacteria bacterium]